MNYKINYRGKEITFNIERGENKNFVSEQLGSVLKKIVTIGHETNDNSEVLSVKYITFTEVDGNMIDGSVIRKPSIKILGSYDKLYNTTGNFSNIIKAQLNEVSKKEIAEDCFAFNPYNNYEEIQPITFDLNSSSTGVTVSVIDKPLEGELLYSIGEGSEDWVSLPTNEIPLPVGEYVIYIKNSIENIPFKGEFQIIEG